MMPRRRRLLFSLATILLFLGGVEGLARLLPAASDAAAGGAALRFHQNPELQEGNARFWQTDPLLFWRMRPDLDVDFGGMPLRTNGGGFRDPAHRRDSSRPLVICLGDSTTFGWGVLDEAERFSNRLESNGLSTPLEEPGHTPVQVFNFGQSGYSSVQGQRLLEREALPLDPAAVIFLFGPNDYARASGRSDRDQPVAGEGGATVRLQSVLHHSAFYRRVAAALLKARDRTATSAAGNSLAGGSETTILRRVPLEQFKHNLREMILSTRATGAIPILATYPRRPLNPLVPCPPPVIAEELNGWEDRVRSEATPLLETVGEILSGQAGSPDEALALWRNLPQEVLQTASGLYGEAWLSQQAGRPDEAEKMLTLAEEKAAESGCGLDLFSTRLFRYLEEPAAAAYNRVIREVAGEQAVPLVDAAAILTAAQLELADVQLGAQTPPSADPAMVDVRWRTALLARWFGGDSFFVDVVHPSGRGHASLATALKKVMDEDVLPTP
jgi:lysophospholipase L1-like esterase